MNIQPKRYLSLLEEPKRNAATLRRPEKPPRGRSSPPPFELEVFEYFSLISTIVGSEKTPHQHQQ